MRESYIVANLLRNLRLGSGKGLLVDHDVTVPAVQVPGVLTHPILAAALDLREHVFDDAARVVFAGGRRALRLLQILGHGDSFPFYYWIGRLRGATAVAACVASKNKAPRNAGRLTIFPSDQFTSKLRRRRDPPWERPT